VEFAPFAPFAPWPGDRVKLVQKGIIHLLHMSSQRDGANSPKMRVKAFMLIKN